MNPHFETLQAKLKDVEVIILDLAAASALRFTVCGEWRALSFARMNCGGKMRSHSRRDGQE
jgi:hypothetical protein